MSLEGILNEIDAEIDRLQQAKRLLSGTAILKRGPGRPRGASPKPKRRVLSAAARAKIAAAQKARWAKARKATAKADSGK